MVAVGPGETNYVIDDYPSDVGYNRGSHQPNPNHCTYSVANDPQPSGSVSCVDVLHGSLDDRDGLLEYLPQT